MLVHIYVCLVIDCSFVILLYLMLKEKPNGISKIPMAESLTCGTFAGFFGNFILPTLALVFCHLACCVGFVFCHVALLLCCLGFLSRCICCCAPPLCYIASLFCFFFSFLVCISWLLFCFCSLSSSLASSFGSSWFFTFSLPSSSTQGVLLWLLCFFPIYVFFRLFGAWLTLLGFFSRLFSFFFDFFYCMLAFIFCASLMYFLDDYHSPNHITVSLSNAEFREGRCILSYRDYCFPYLPHGADAFLSDWYRILPILNWQFLEVNYEINYLFGVNLLSMFAIC